MRQLSSAAEMKVDGIYNLVYAGDNKAYAKINGKRTIRVMSRGRSRLEYVQVFDQFGDPAQDDIPATPTAVKDTSTAFKDYKIFEPENEGEWFKHSLKFSSLGEAIEQGVLTIRDIKEYPVHSSHCPFVADIGKRGLRGVSADFEVEDKTSQPLLQRVYIRWGTWEDLFRDFDRYGVNARR